jgi:hypothetical protein
MAPAAKSAAPKVSYLDLVKAAIIALADRVRCICGVGIEGSGEILRGPRRSTELGMEEAFF